MVKFFSENLKLLCDGNYCKLFEEWRWRWITTPNDDNKCWSCLRRGPKMWQSHHWSLSFDSSLAHHVAGMVKQCSFWNIVMLLAWLFLPSSFSGLEAHDVTGIRSPLIVRIASIGAPFGFPMDCLARGKMLSPWRVMSCWCCCANGHMRWGVGRKMLSLKVSTRFTVCYSFSLQKNMDGEISLHVVKERIRVLFKWLTLLNDQAP